MRRASDGTRQVTQQIRWLPALRMVVGQMMFEGPKGSRHALELHTERAYWPHEVATWLMDVGFLLREVLDAATLSAATTCPGRIVVIAQKPAEAT